MYCVASYDHKLISWTVIEAKQPIYEGVISKFWYVLIETKIKFGSIEKPLQKYNLVQPMSNKRREKRKEKRNKCIIFLTMHYILIRIYNYTTWVHLHTTLNVDLTLTTTPIFRVPCNSSKKKLDIWSTSKPENCFTSWK